MEDVGDIREECTAWRTRVYTIYSICIQRLFRAETVLDRGGGGVFGLLT